MYIHGAETNTQLMGTIYPYTPVDTCIYCAQWRSHAWGTLGYVPQQLEAAPHRCSADSSVVDRESSRLNGLEIERHCIAIQCI